MDVVVSACLLGERCRYDGGSKPCAAVQQLAGICGFWTYYLYTGDRDFLHRVYDASVRYTELWTIGSDHLVSHRAGSWDWMDWGSFADVTAIENAWFYYALSCIRNMAQVLGKDSAEIAQKMREIETGYASLWTKNGYKSKLPSFSNPSLIISITILFLE